MLKNNDVQLLCHYHEPVDPKNCPGLVTLLHGWEGSADSTYILRAADHLHRLGYAIARLNFRDHGPTHHLNRELFHSCRLDEVVDAVADIARRYPEWPLTLLGYSLGGNFSLRVACRAPEANIPLHRVVAVCPLIDPARGMDALEAAPPLYRRYFMRKWRRSLARKQALYPQDIDVRHWLGLDMRTLTARLVESHTQFATLADYFAGYSVGGERLRDLQIPCSILSTADDPVIPVADVESLPVGRYLRVTIFDAGGHCGFVDRFAGSTWLERRIARELAADTTPVGEPLPC